MGLGPEHKQLLRKAHRTLSAARALRRKGYAEDAVSRAYYAMFHAARAFLIRRGILRHKHSAVIAAFGQTAVRSGRVSGATFRLLTRVFETRNTADHDAAWEPAPEEVDEVLSEAARFIKAVERVMK